MDLPTFISTYTGQAVEVDGVLADTGQCVQLVALYCQKVLNVPFPDANAKDWWDNPTCQESFDQIPVGQPVQPGDIVVFAASTVINSPEFGHIDICVSPFEGGFVGFDSNWGGVYNAQGYPVAHEVQHSFQDVLGYLRIKEIDMKPTVNQIMLAYQLALNTNPTQEQITAQLEQPDLSHVLSSLAEDSQKAWAAANGEATALAPGKYVVNG